MGPFNKETMIKSFFQPVPISVDGLHSFLSTTSSGNDSVLI